MAGGPVGSRKPSPGHSPALCPSVASRRAANAPWYPYAVLTGHVCPRCLRRTARALHGREARAQAKGPSIRPGRHTRQYHPALEAIDAWLRLLALLACRSAVLQSVAPTVIFRRRTGDRPRTPRSVRQLQAIEEATSCKDPGLPRLGDNREARSDRRLRLPSA